MVEIEEIVEEPPAATVPSAALPPKEDASPDRCRQDDDDDDDDEFFDALSDPEDSEEAQDLNREPGPEQRPHGEAGDSTDAVVMAEAPSAAERTCDGGASPRDDDDDGSEGFVLVDQGNLAGSEESTSTCLSSEALADPGTSSSNSRGTTEETEAAAAAVGPPHSNTDEDVAEATADSVTEELNKEEVPAEPEEPLYTEDEKKEMLKAADDLKAEGNQLFGQANFGEAAEKYTEAVAAGPSGAPELAVYYANRAACMLKLEQFQSAVDDCTEALRLQPGYVKALLRRGLAAEKLEDVETALADAKKVVELEPGNQEASRTVRRLEPVVAQKREQLKEEMMGKLKDLGNTVLGKFGMSLDNFQAVQDPATGGYSINFKS